MTWSADITEEHVAAARLRIVLDEKLGRSTPEWVRRLAETSVVATPQARSIVMGAGGGGVANLGATAEFEATEHGYREVGPVAAERRSREERPGSDVEISVLTDIDSRGLFGLMNDLGDQGPDRWGYSREAGTRLRVTDLPDPDLPVLLTILMSWLSRNGAGALLVRRGDQAVEIRAGQNLDVAALASGLVSNS
jgi:hypothetical protein